MKHTIWGSIDPHEFTQSTTIGSGDYPSGAIIHPDVTVTIQSGAEVTMSHEIIMEEGDPGSGKQPGGEQGIIDPVI